MSVIEYSVVKAAGSDLATCEDIMGQVYAENPSHWPHGLRRSQLDDLYLVREAGTEKPAGFVGWQQFHEGHRKVGYYAVGILPAYRQRGWAKSAVAQLLEQKAAGVDEVRALIHHTNAPSLALADALGVPVKLAYTKQAMSFAAKALTKAKNFALSPTTHGVAGAGLYDYGMHGGGFDAESVQHYLDSFEDSSAMRPVMALLNGALLRNTSKNWRPGMGEAGFQSGLLSLGGVPAKDLALSALPVMTSLPDAIRSYTDTAATSATAATNQANATVQNTNTVKNLGLLLGALGAGGLGLMGYNAFKKKPEQMGMGGAPMLDDRGKVRITLPTRNPEDQETQIEFPFDATSLGLSNSVQGALGRDVRRRLRDEARSRVRNRYSTRINTAETSVNA